MAVHQLAPAARKTIAESAVCFGCALGGLAAAAVVLQWLMGLIG